MAHSNGPNMTLEEQLSRLNVSNTPTRNPPMSGTQAYSTSSPSGAPPGYQSGYAVTQGYPMTQGYSTAQAYPATQGYSTSNLPPTPNLGATTNSPGSTSSNQHTPQPRIDNSYTTARPQYTSSPYAAPADSPIRALGSRDMHGRQESALGNQQVSPGGSSMSARTPQSSTLGSPFSVDRRQMQVSQQVSTPSPTRQSSRSTESSPSAASSPYDPETSPPKPEHHRNLYEAQLDILKYMIEGQKVPSELEKSVKGKLTPIEVVRSACRYAHFRVLQVRDAIRDLDNKFYAKGYDDRFLYPSHQPGFAIDTRAEHAGDEAWIMQARPADLKYEIRSAKIEREEFWYVQVNLQDAWASMIQYERMAAEGRIRTLRQEPGRNLSPRGRGGGRGGRRQPGRRTLTPREGSDRALIWR